MALQTLSVAGATVNGSGIGPNFGAQLTSGEAGSSAGNIELYFTSTKTGTTAGGVAIVDLGTYVNLTVSQE